MEKICFNLEDTKNLAFEFAKLLKGAEVVTLTGDLGAGNHSVVVVYLGDDAHDVNYAYESFSIEEKPTPQPITPNVEITVPSDVKAGDDVSVEIKIPNATGNVSVIVDGNEIIVALSENFFLLKEKNVARLSIE